MGRYLLIVVLVLVTVWATGCIVVDAEKLESRKSATIQSDECVIRQSLGVGEPAREPAGQASGAVMGQ